MRCRVSQKLHDRPAKVTKTLIAFKFSIKSKKEFFSAWLLEWLEKEEGQPFKITYIYSFSRKPINICSLISKYTLHSNENIHYKLVYTLTFFWFSYSKLAINITVNTCSWDWILKLELLVSQPWNPLHQSWFCALRGRNEKVLYLNHARMMIFVNGNVLKSFLPQKKICFFCFACLVLMILTSRVDLWLKL